MYCEEKTDIRRFPDSHHGFRFKVKLPFRPWPVDEGHPAGAFRQTAKAPRGKFNIGQGGADNIRLKEIL
jgi:hypothetical protein